MILWSDCYRTKPLFIDLFGHSGTEALLMAGALGFDAILSILWSQGDAEGVSHALLNHGAANRGP